MAEQRVTVELYTLSTCPWSRNTRAWLDNRHIAYDFVDYDLAGEDMQRHIQEEMVSRGASAFPFVKFGDADFIVGFNPDAFARLLGLPKDAELEAAGETDRPAADVVDAPPGDVAAPAGESGEED
ncbi:MAG: glutaredoxin family protein [Actinobacteria bacterium]|nr:glutaredoxin family protein [Actinomycetota bacterium]